MSRLIVLGFLASLAACASNPPLTFQYYHAQSSLEMTVDARVGCRDIADGSREPFIVFGFKPVVSAEADTTKAVKFNTAFLGNRFSNNDIKLEYFEDGRLKGINSSATGQGTKVVESAISLATTVFGFDGAPEGSPIVPRFDAANVCAYVDNTSDKKTKLLTLKFTGLYYPARDENNSLNPDLQSAAHLQSSQDLAQFVGALALNVASDGPPALPASLGMEGDRPKAALGGGGFSALTLRQPGTGAMSVLRTIQVMQEGVETSIVLVEWLGKARFGQFGSEYTLLVPNAAAFGKRTFAVELFESGALKSAKYTDESGLSDALNSTQEVIDFANGSTLKERTDALNQEADYLKALDRLARCQADRESC